MLSRSSFKRYQKPERVPVVHSPLKRPVNMPMVSSHCASIPKDDLVVSETYRRLVAALPCKACGIQGYSQTAHLPPVGKGIKQSDLLTFPLCCTRPGITGCHVEYDQYRLFPRAKAMQVGAAWAADTQRQIYASGQWPKAIPIPEFLLSKEA